MTSNSPSSGGRHPPPKPAVNKKSLFERQRAEAEAKRQREAAETAAVYEEFVNSFDVGGNASGGTGGRFSGNAFARPPMSRPSQPALHPSSQLQPRQQPPLQDAASLPLPPPPPPPPPPLSQSMGVAAIGGGGGRRHFSMPSAGPASLRNSGPGTLGSAPSGGVGSSNSKKRPFPFDASGSRGAVERRTNRGDAGRLRRLGGGVFDDDSDEDNGVGSDYNGSSRDDDDDHRYSKKSTSGGGISRNNYNDGVGAGRLHGSGTGTAEYAEEKALSKPTVRLTNLPPNMSPSAVKNLIAQTRLTVDHVRMVTGSATAGSGYGSDASIAATAARDRKSATAIATLSAETAASDIDAAVSALQNHYLGFGYYLNLHRHLSSAVIAAAAPSSSVLVPSASTASAQPFGARPVPINRRAGGPGGPALSGSAGFAPPPYQGRGPAASAASSYQRGRIGIPPPSSFLPPALPSSSSFGGGGGGSSSSSSAHQRDPILYVPVRPPRDIKKLRMIHKVIENVLEHGPAFEALLMSRADVQREKKWDWIWDARSEAGVWYRYRLWETVSGLEPKRRQGKYVSLFEGSSAWQVPDQPLPYEFTTGVSEFVTDSEYNSSDDSDMDDGPAGDGNKNSANADGEDMFLNPIEKARLTHLLARLPTTLSKLRKGDIARVTAFALSHASRGSDEIVDLIVSNVERPFAFAKAASATAGAATTMTTATAATPADVRDTSGAQLIGVYAVSDILAASAISGMRHAWRYRHMFEVALRDRKVFETLGLLGDKLGWGRLRVDKWKRSIGLVLSQWEGWSVFSTETQEHLVHSFENPPRPKPKADAGALPATVTGATASDSAAPEAATAAADSMGAAVASAKSRWKTVDKAAAAPGETVRFKPVGTSADAMDIDDASVDVDGRDEAGAGARSEADAGVDAGVDAGAADYDEDDDDAAYRSEYTDDETLDLACLDLEDIDGTPMDKYGDDGDGGTNLGGGGLDGIPLTAEEITALGCGEIVEMSEEGEVGTDDEDDNEEEGDGDSDSDGDGDGGGEKERVGRDDGDGDGDGDEGDDGNHKHSNGESGRDGNGAGKNTDSPSGKQGKQSRQRQSRGQSDDVRAAVSRHGGGGGGRDVRADSQKPLQPPQPLNSPMPPTAAAGAEGAAGRPPTVGASADVNAKAPIGGGDQLPRTALMSRRRLRAVDMFADSDAEKEGDEGA